MATTSTNYAEIPSPSTTPERSTFSIRRNAKKILLGIAVALSLFGLSVHFYSKTRRSTYLGKKHLILQNQFLEMFNHFYHPSMFTSSHGFVPLSNCQTSRFPCTAYVPSPAGATFTEYRVCASGYKAETCKCGGVQFPGGPEKPIVTRQFKGVSDESCSCDFKSQSDPQQAGWYMTLRCTKSA